MDTLPTTLTCHDYHLRTGSVRAGTGLGGGVLGVNRYAAGGDIVGKQPPLPSRLARASLHGGDPETQVRHRNKKSLETDQW